jgi:LuxR family transcriptional regulator, maltose regulon positive regulatory protein
MSPPSHASPTRHRVRVSPEPPAGPPALPALRVVEPPAPGAHTLPQLGAKTVLVGLGRTPLPYTLVQSKLAVPAARPADVSRTALVNRLRALRAERVVVIVAPAGYGKTTLCAQWAERARRACAWLTVDERDNDPVVFVRHLVAAVDQAVGLGSDDLERISRPGESVLSGALPALAAAIGAVRKPLLLVLDDAHLLRSDDAAAALALVAEHLAPGSVLAVTGRRAPRLPLARLRVAGDLAELKEHDLRFTSRETALALRAVGADGLDADELAALCRRTEGWPAGVRLLAGPGGDVHLSEYFRSEVLGGLTEGERAFARRTSVVDPLCRAVLGAGARGTGRRLEALVHEGAFLAPADAGGRWFRYHGLFAEFLRRELETEEPELVPQLYARAADWYEAHGEPEAAVHAAAAAGDDERVTRLVGALAVPAYSAGELAAVGAWFEGLADGASLGRHPAIAAVGAWMAAIRGQTGEAQRLLAVAERRRKDALADGTPLAALVSLVRAALCSDGADRMREDAEAARASMPSNSLLLPSATMLCGVAHLLAGDVTAADNAFAQAAAAAERLGSPVAGSLALAQRSLIAAAEGRHAAAENLARAACAMADTAGLRSYPTRGAELAALARAALRHGRWDEARAELSAAAEILPSLTGSLPWLAVQVRLELARAHLALRDAHAARRLLSEANELLGQRPGLGVLVAQAAELEQGLAELDLEAGGSSLTAAELRLLPLLATHLSFREIGERLFVSRNTIKTQAISVYRKLGVSTRSAAIARAQQLGLVEAGAASEITPSG